MAATLTATVADMIRTEGLGALLAAAEAYCCVESEWHRSYPTGQETAAKWRQAADAIADAALACDVPDPTEEA